MMLAVCRKVPLGYIDLRVAARIELLATLQSHLCAGLLVLTECHAVEQACPQVDLALCLAHEAIVILLW